MTLSSIRKFTCTHAITIGSTLTAVPADVTAPMRPVSVPARIDYKAP